MPHIEGSSSVTIPGMMGGSFQTTLGKIGKAIKSLFTAKSEASTQHRVVDGGNGNYTLMRKGRGGAMRLDMVGRKPEPTRTVSSQQGSGSTAPSRTTTGSRDVSLRRGPARAARRRMSEQATRRETRSTPISPAAIRDSRTCATGSTTIGPPRKRMTGSRATASRR